MNTPDPPAVPDPIKTAAAQSAANKETAVAQYGLGATNQITPQGQLNYTQIGKWEDGTPRFQAEQTLSPQNTKLLNQTQELQGNLSQFGLDQTKKLSEHLGTPLNAEGLPQSGTTPATAPGLMGSYGVERPAGVIGDAGAIQTSLPQANQSGQIGDAGGIQRTLGPTHTGVTTSYGPTDYSSDRSKVEEALYGRINPQLERDRSQAETRLINSGVRPGTEAWTRAQDQLGRNANDARGQAILAGGAEQSRLAGLAQQAAQFANTAHGQEFGERLQEGTFGNQAQGTAFAQNQQRQQAADAATAANNEARAREATFGRESQGLQFQQNQARSQAYDAAALANTEANRTATQFANQTGQQGFTNQQAIAAAQDNARQRALQERLTFRNQPIQEISALMSGSQVSQPNFVNAPAPGVAPTDLIGATANATNAANQQYAQQMAQQKALMGGLFQLGSAGIGAI